MGYLSAHFKRSEFACHCGCGQDTVDSELITVLEELRAEFSNKKITINSGNRCEAHNKKIGGMPHSFHLRSKAADIVVDDEISQDVADYLDYQYSEKYGIGVYENFTHIDVREKKARW